MPKWPITDDDARAMYVGGRGNDEAKWYAERWGSAFATGIGPRRWVRLEVPGRRTGRPTSVPLGLADADGRWYLVSMLGECHWVKNVRANGGRAVLRHGRAVACALVEVPVEARARILQRYVEVVPGGRPHIPVPKGRPVAEFASVADRYPVFELRRPGDGRPLRPPRSWFPWVAGALVLLAAAGRRSRHRWPGGTP